MNFCNICVKNSEQVEQISESKVLTGDTDVPVNELLQIFQMDIVKFLLDDKDAFICSNCLKQLKKCFEFVQQIKDSEKKISRGKEIITEHDYFEMRYEVGNVTVNDKITILKDTVTERVNSATAKSKLKFKPIVPKTTSSKQVDKKVAKSLNTKSRLYKCLQCTEYFKSYKHLKEHEQEFCKSKFVKYVKVCNFCHKCYSKENSLREHVSSAHPREEYLCCLCQDKLFAAKGYLSRHIQISHQQKSLQFFCGECADMPCLSSQEILREHFLHSHPHENINATSSDDDMDLEMHEEFLDEFLLAHTNDNSFQFSECWEALDLHLPDMLQENPANMNSEQELTQSFACPKCYEQFKSPQPLLRHLADIHDLPVLVCRVCNKCFNSFKDFKRHKLQKCVKSSTIHAITLDCPYCAKKFKNCSNLKQHLRIVHCQLKKHICQLCDKQFPTLDHLKKHVLSQHQNERKHSCTVCYKKFTQLGHLKQHFAIHTTGKTIHCLQCSAKFWRKIDLQRHCKKKHVAVRSGE